MNLSRYEVWAVVFCSLASFFSEQPELERRSEDTFYYGGGTVTLVPMKERSLRSGMVFPQTGVRFEGGGFLPELRRRFELKFLTAGG